MSIVHWASSTMPLCHACVCGSRTQARTISNSVDQSKVEIVIKNIRPIFICQVNQVRVDDAAANLVLPQETSIPVCS